MTETGRYLYAVVTDLRPDALRDLTGIDGAPLGVVGYGGLQGLVGPVDLDAYGEEGLRRNLEDLGWVEATARAHDDVVRAAFALGPTAPMRLATVFRDEDGVRRSLEERYDDLRAALERIAGRVEWSVKVVTRQRQADPVPASAPTGGAVYLRRKRAESQARQSADEDAVAAADRVAETVRTAPEAVAVRRLEPQDPRLSGIEGRMLLNLAVLVDGRTSGEFATRVRALTADEQTIALHLGGPWPAYSFATMEV